MNIVLNRAAVMALAVSSALLAASPSWAGKPEWLEQGKGHEKGGRDKDRGAAQHNAQGGAMLQVGGTSVGVSIHFGDAQRRAVHDYYAPRVAAGKCPPGLAKKNNGCLPPGQAKQWRLGQPLAGGVVMYPIPRDLEIRLGTPPAGHKYVRVAADILLIAVGTSMVVDAIEDLAGL